MKLAFCLLAISLGVALTPVVGASESASDCAAAVTTLQAGFQAQPENPLELFLDALQTNPGCRRDLFVAAIRFVKEEPEQIEKVIFIARQEFPDELTSFAEAALETAPENAAVIREAFFADADTMTAKLNPVPESTESSLVALPAEAMQLDAEIREAIARVTARVEGKLWPEQEIPDRTVAFRERDEVRIPKLKGAVDETGMENAIPVDGVDERIAEEEKLVIRDEPKATEESFFLDESKFNRGKQDSIEAREARKKAIAPAGQAMLPDRPRLARSSVYYIPPAKGDFRSTIDQDEKQRPPLVIRSVPAAPTLPE